VTRWRVHGESPLYTSEWLSLRVARVEPPRSETFSHHVVRMSFDAAGVVIADASRGILLLHRHRFITDTWGWEIPAGGVEAGETPEQAVEREAVEETGWRPHAIEPLGSSYPSNGQSDQLFRFFLAHGATEVGEPEPSETDRVEWFGADDVRGLIGAGEIMDGLSATALGLAFALRRI
jgi:8-oxo-dGTP pyrophosphatase MutT (NUDIX family)